MLLLPNYFVLKLLKKILSVVLKTRYDVESLAQRQNEIDQIITNQVVPVTDASVLITDQNEEFEMCLPIINKESLKEFEQKLITSRVFKSNAVSQLCKLFYFTNYLTMNLKIIVKLCILLETYPIIVPNVLDK